MLQSQSHFAHLTLSNFFFVFAKHSQILCTFSRRHNLLLSSKRKRLRMKPPRPLRLLDELELHSQLSFAQLSLSLVPAQCAIKMCTARAGLGVNCVQIKDDLREAMNLMRYLK